MAEQELLEKKVAFYQVFLSAWTASRMEKDKQVLTLSALAIGLLMTFRSELDDVLAFCVWLLAGVFFVISIVIILLIFSQNSDYIEQVIRDDGQGQEVGVEKSLQRKTLWAFRFFVFGVILTVFLAVYGTGFIVTKGNEMSDDRNRAVPLREGFEGASKLKPQASSGTNSSAGSENFKIGNAPLEKGLEGAGNLKPQAPQQSGGGNTSGESHDGSNSGDKKK